MLEAARRNLVRLTPEQAFVEQAEGAVVVDTGRSSSAGVEATSRTRS